MAAGLSESTSTGRQRSLAPRDQHLARQGSQSAIDVRGGQVNAASSKNAEPPKRRRIACRSCRQGKSRCEGLDQGAKSCNRCAESSRECIVDTDYRRVNQKSKLRQLQEQVDHLRSQAQARSHSIETRQNCEETRTPFSSSCNTQQPRHTEAFSQSSNFGSKSSNNPTSSADNENAGTNATNSSHAGSPTGSITVINPKPASVARSLDQVSVSPEQTTQLFNLYFSCYHPYFPILDRSSSPDTTYAVSPLLFWTVILIAARKYDDDVSLLGTLLPSVKRLLWEMIATPPCSISSLRAISLLCIWPFPTSSMSTDISYTLTGVLVSGALHVGLHRPALLQDFSRIKCQLGPRERDVAVKAWVGCYIAAESVTIRVGQPSYIESDATIEEACEFSNPFGLTTGLYYMLLVQKFCNRIHLTMKDNYGSESLMCMKLLEKDFQSLKAHVGVIASTFSVSSTVSDMHSVIYADLLLLAAHLQLRTYYLFDDSDSANRRQGVLGAYSAAIELMTAVRSANNKVKYAKYLPPTFVAMCYLAATVIMKVANSSYSHFVDVESGKSAFNTVIGIARDCSIEDNDIAGRMTKILAQLWNVHRTLALEREQPPTLKIKSRSLYSIVHDSLWLWREYFGERPGNGAPSLPAPLVEATPSSLDVEPPYTPPPSNGANTQGASAGAMRSRLASMADDPLRLNTSSSDNGFALSSFEGLHEEENWMWSVGIPSLIDADPYGFSNTYNFECIPQDAR